jgi:peptide chain release factor 3
VAQFFKKINDAHIIVGTVGVLQFDVIQYRLEHEYGAICRFDALGYVKACWLESDKQDILNSFIKKRANQIAQDKDGKYIYLAETRWSLDREIKENPEINFHSTSEF